MEQKEKTSCVREYKNEDREESVAGVEEYEK